MAQHILFKGIKRVLSNNTAYSGASHGDFLYFVRESTGATSGDIWFQGFHYGHFGEHDLDAINTALEGFLTGQDETGYTNVKEYIDAAIAQVESNVTTIELGSGSFSGLTLTEDDSTEGKLDYTITLTNVAPADELAQEIADREAADSAISQNLQTTATTLYNMITGATDNLEEEIAQAKAEAITASTSYTQTEIEKLDATVSATSTNSYMTVQVAEVDGKLDSVSIDDAALKGIIEAMDLPEVHEAGKAIIAVYEEDGVVSATAGTVAAQYVDVADAAGKFTGSTVEAVLAEIDTAYKAADAAIIGDATSSGNTLGKLEDRIEALAGDAKEYHLVEVTTGLDADIKVEYKLVDADGNQSGDTISIPKDSHIVSITYITDPSDEHYQNLEYVYLDVCGATKTEYVDMSQLVLKTEFASGVGITNHVAHGVVDPTSEAFLTVGADGFKLSGVQDAIDAAKTAATANTQSQIEALDYSDTAVTGQYVSEVDETNGVISVQRANVSEATLNNYTKGSDATAVAATDTVNQAISKLENQVDAAKAAATTEVLEGTDAGNNLSIASGTASDGHVQYTISLTDVASASGLAEEISARTTADTAMQNEIDAIETAVGLSTSGTYIADDGEFISAATSTLDATAKLNDALIAEIAARDAADEALEDMIQELATAATQDHEAFDERLDAIEGAYITAVTVNDVNATVANNAASVTIDAGDVEIGKALTGSTVSAATTDTVDNVLQAIIDNLNNAIAGSYTGVTSSGQSMVITGDPTDDLGQNIEINKQTASLTKAQDGHIFLEQDAQDSNKVYGAMYWIDEETTGGTQNNG